MKKDSIVLDQNPARGHAGMSHEILRIQNKISIKEIAHNSLWFRSSIHMRGFYVRRSWRKSLFARVKYMPACCAPSNFSSDRPSNDDRIGTYNRMLIPIANNSSFTPEIWFYFFNDLKLFRVLDDFYLMNRSHLAVDDTSGNTLAVSKPILVCSGVRSDSDWTSSKKCVGKQHYKE